MASHACQYHSLPEEGDKVFRRFMLNQDFQAAAHFLPFVLIYKLKWYCFISSTGRIGLWKDVFTVSMNDKFDAVYRQKMGKSDLTFDFGL